MDKILIKDLTAHGIIGIHEQERNKPQKILINLTIFTDTRNAGQSDDIDDCIDYDTIASLAKEHAENAQRFTVEALAEDIAAFCLQFPNVYRVFVRVEKPNAISFAKSAGVEIERLKGT
jgi:FolB domain-containing protein